MSSKIKAAAEAEREDATNKLREMFPPGSTVYTILRHVSRSGMQRSISIVGKWEDGRLGNVDWLAARALGYRLDRDRGGLKVSGCGMDMGFHLVYSLSRVLWHGNFECIGQGCSSNDHSNGDRDRSPHQHSDGGYALRHCWL